MIVYFNKEQGEEMVYVDMATLRSKVRMSESSLYRYLKKMPDTHKLRYRNKILYPYSVLKLSKIFSKLVAEPWLGTPISIYTPRIVKKTCPVAPIVRISWTKVNYYPAYSNLSSSLKLIFPNQSQLTFINVILVKDFETRIIAGLRFFYVKNFA